MYVNDEEAKRLFTLRELELSEEPRDPAFDRITLLTTMLLRVPAAGISFVDANSAWHNGTTGIGWLPPVPREHSIAARIVESRQALRIDDASTDPAFQSHPLVRDGGIRAAMGVPITLAGDVVVGALAALDTRVRQFTDDELRQLELLRDVVVGLLEERLRLPTLRNAELEALHAAFDATEIGIAIATLASDGDSPRLIYVNDAILSLSGCSRADILTGRSAFFDDTVNAEVGKQIARAMIRESAETFSARVVRGEETRHWDVRVIPIGSYAGEMRFILLISDITHEAALAMQIERVRRERAESDRIVGALFSEMSDFLIIADATRPSSGGPIATYANASLAGFVGVDAVSLEGQPVLTLLDATAGEKLRASLTSRFEHFLPIATEVPLRRADGSIGWVAGTGSVIRDESGSPTHWLLVGRDVTLRKEHYRETTQFVTALDSADEPIVIYQADGDAGFEISYSNRSASESQAYAFDELLRQNGDERHCALRAHLNSGRNFQALVHRSSGPKSGWLSLDVRPTLASDGSLRSVVAIEHRLDWQRAAEHDSLGVAVSLGREIRSFGSAVERRDAIDRVLTVEWSAVGRFVNSMNRTGVDIDVAARCAAVEFPRGFIDDEHVSVEIQWSGELSASRTTALRVFLEYLSGN